MTTEQSIEARKTVERAWAAHLESADCTQDMTCTICADYERQIYGA